MRKRTHRIFWTAVFAFIVAGSAGTWLRAASTLPGEISDEAFWKMVSSFSEEGGYFRFENFLSNELGFQYVIPGLKEIHKPGGVYLGVGPEQNFTYISALQPKIAFILDIRRQNMIEHLMYKALFELSENRADFLSRLYARKRPSELSAESAPGVLFAGFDAVASNRELAQKNLEDIKGVLVKNHKFDLSRDDLDSIEYVYKVFVAAGPDLDYTAGGGFGGGGSPTYEQLMTASDKTGHNWSYLATESNYRFMRAMEMKNLIVPLVGDFAGPKALRTVGQYLADHDARVSVFYTSNVEQYLFQDAGQWRRFYRNVGLLPLDSSSMFIRSVNAGSYGRIGGYGMRFESLTSSMEDLIKGFDENRIRYYDDVIRVSR